MVKLMVELKVRGLLLYMKICFNLNLGGSLKQKVSDATSSVKCPSDI